MKLIVGLGNPGREYEGTRHNVGFALLARLAGRHAAESPRAKFDAEVAEAQIAGQRVLLLAPQTFMNLSGRSVRQATDFYKIPPEDVLLVCDDFHLPIGKIRLRPRGTDGGQKGLADIFRHLGTNEVSRLRIGIGPVPERWDPADFVLRKFEGSESETIEEQLLRSCRAAETWVADGIDAAMNHFNADPQPPKPPASENPATKNPATKKSDD